MDWKLIVKVRWFDRNGNSNSILWYSIPYYFVIDKLGKHAFLIKTSNFVPLILICTFSLISWKIF